MVSIFWIAAPILVAIAIGLLAVPLWRRSPATIGNEDDAGIDALGVLRDQRRELDREVDAGRMSEDERAARLAELRRRVIDEGLVRSPAAATATPASAAPAARRGLAIVVALAVPLVALPMYLLIGTPAALDPRALEAAAAEAAHGDITPERFRAMLNELKARLAANPGDADGWRMLAGGLRMAEDIEGSVDAYARAVALRPGDAKLLVDYADALALSKGRDLSGKPFELVQQALKIDPRLPKALAMAGAAEWAKGRKAEAKAYWQRLLEVVPTESDDAANLRRMLAQIDGDLAAAGAPGSTGSAPSAPSASGAPSSTATAGTPAATSSGAAPAQPAAGTTLTGIVRIGPALARDVAPDDTLYILARPAQGPRMPLAVIRRKASELPYTFSLGDAQAMPGGAPLSSAAQVRVEARISKSGDAIAKPGDLRGESDVVAPGAANLSIVIDQVVR